MPSNITSMPYKTPYIPRCFPLFTDKSTAGAHGVTLTIVFSSLAFFIVLSSLAMMVGLWQTNKTFTTVKRILFFLCVLDLLVGVFVAPIQSAMVVFGARADCHLIQYQAFSNAFFLMMADHVLLLLVFVRYHKIADTKFHKFFSNKIFIWTMIFISTIVSITFASWYVINRKLSDIWSRAYFYITIGTYTAVVLTGIITMNVKLLCFMDKAAKVAVEGFKHQRHNYRKSVTKTILYMSISAALCYLPLTVTFITSGIFFQSKDKEGLDVIYFMVPWSQVPLLMNSGLNSAIYIARTKSIKQYYRSVFHGETHDRRTESLCSSRFNSIANGRHNAVHTSV